MTLTRNRAQNAVAEALRLRASIGISPIEPVRVYDIARQLGVEVWFVACPSLEGVLFDGKRPAMFISSLRPLGRRAYTCAHEIGHWKLGDGIVVDLLTEHLDGSLFATPRERAAQLFAGTLLMPKPAVLNAFSLRSLSPNNSTALQILTLASLFGVGYATFINHLSFGLKIMSPNRAAELKKRRIHTVRAEAIGSAEATSNLIIVDSDWPVISIDTEVGDKVLVDGAPELTAGEGVIATVDGAGRTILEATEPGRWPIKLPNDVETLFQASRSGFTGLARYLYLPEEGDCDQ